MHLNLEPLNWEQVADSRRLSSIEGPIKRDARMQIAGVTVVTEGTYSMAIVGMFVGTLCERARAWF
jgi:hypothetical protein